MNGNEGTLMVLKRFFVTALGALGLGALGVGAASAQFTGDIPAPGNFEGQIKCSMNAGMAMNTMNDLNALLMRDDDNPETGPRMIGGMGTEEMVKARGELVRIVSAGMPNCGGGVVFTPADGSAYVVAKGYKMAREVFDGEAGDLDAITMGPIYEAGEAEWVAQDMVRQRIAERDAEVGKVDMAREALLEALLDSGYEGYQPLAAREGDDRLPDVRVRSSINRTRRVADAEVGFSGAKNKNGQGEFVVHPTDEGKYLEFVTAVDRYVRGNPNFADDQGMLSPLEGTFTSRSIRAIKEEMDIAVKAVEVLNKGVEDIKALIEAGGGGAADLDNSQDLADAKTALEGAKLEADYRKMQYDAAYSAALQSAAMDAGPAELAELRAAHDRYQMSLGGLDAADTELRKAVTAREAATDVVLAKFQDPGAFFEQLVARRQYEAGEAEGDEAAAAAAETALEAAKKAQKDYMAHAKRGVDDPDHPSYKLAEVLLEEDGDDGQALVDAVATTYDKTVDNKGNIDTHEMRLDALYDADGGMDGSPSGMVADNADGIAANAGNIAMNKTATETNAGRQRRRHRGEQDGDRVERHGHRGERGQHRQQHVHDRFQPCHDRRVERELGCGPCRRGGFHGVGGDAGDQRSRRRHWRGFL